MIMGQKSCRVAALDIGTTKICALQAVMNEDGTIRRLGLGRVPSSGLRAGQVSDIDALAVAIRDAVDRCQKDSGKAIKSVYVGLAGNHAISKNAEMVVNISSSGGVKNKDIERAIEAATQSISAGDNRYRLINRIITGFTVDNVPVQNPLGMHGRNLGVKLHLVYANKHSLQNILASLHRASLNCVEVILESYASGLALLDEEMMNAGVVLVDIGGGTTDIAVFSGGSLVYTDVVPYAGEMVTNDLSDFLRCSFDEAECVKKSYARESAAQNPQWQQQQITVRNVITGQHTSHSLGDLTIPIEARVEEILTMVQEKLVKNNIYAYGIARGVVLTGGTALMPIVQQTAQRIFSNSQYSLGLRGIQGPPAVCVGKPLPHFKSMNDMSDFPCYATVLGLAYYGLSGTSIAASSPYGRTWWQKVSDFLARMCGLR
jgi:cell division protein FtsA